MVDCSALFRGTEKRILDLSMALRRSGYMNSAPAVALNSCVSSDITKSISCQSTLISAKHKQKGRICLYLTTLTMNFNIAIIFFILFNFSLVTATDRSKASLRNVLIRDMIFRKNISRLIKIAENSKPNYDLADKIMKKFYSYNNKFVTRRVMLNASHGYF